LVAYLFGSHAKETENLDSDIDFAIYTSINFSFEDYLLLRSDLSLILKTNRFNLVWMNVADPIINIEKMVFKESTLLRLLFLIAETILDFLEHILASKFDVISESYEDIIKNAMKYEIITENLYKDLKGLGSFRNILAHEYLELNDEQVYQNMKKMIKISDRVLKELKDQIFMK